MIKTFKVTVEGEQTSFYIEVKYREKIVNLLANFDVLSPVNLGFPLPKPDQKVERFYSKEEGGCIRCGKKRRTNGKSKQYCDNCRKKNKEKRN